MNTRSQSSTSVPPSTASFLERANQGRPVQHGDVVFNPSGNPALTELSPALRKQEMIKVQVGGIMQGCPTCNKDPHKSFRLWTESTLLKADGTLEVPVQRPTTANTTECRAWVATWLGSRVSEPCPSASVGGSLYCAFHKHAIEDHYVPVVIKKQK